MAESSSLPCPTRSPEPCRYVYIYTPSLLFSCSHFRSYFCINQSILFSFCYLIFMGISSFPLPEELELDLSSLRDFEFSSGEKRPRTEFDEIGNNGDSSVQEFLRNFLEEEEVFRNLIPDPIGSVSGKGKCDRSNQGMEESDYQFPDYGNSSNNKRARSDSVNYAKASDESTSSAGPSASAPPAGVSHRRLWVKSRSQAWWELVNSPEFSDKDFIKAFRMSRATFDMICEELESVVTKKDTMLRLAIPVRQRVAVCIYRLATGEALREVSKRFGLGISTCHKLVLEVCTAIRTVLMPKFLQWPDDAKLGAIKQEFELLSGIPNVGGTMYTTHIPIIAPKVSVAAYFNKRHTERNQKTSYSITVQGVVDPKGIFTDVCIGWPGSMTDDQVLEKSALFQRANKGALQDVWIVGNSGYPLLDWVLVPYTHQNLWTEHAFNGRIDTLQGVAKDAFMLLKARWSCLQKRTEMKLQDLPVVLGACCVLHNICQMRNEEVSPELRFELFDDEIMPEFAVRSANAVRARDQIAHQLLHRNIAGTGFMF